MRSLSGHPTVRHRPRRMLAAAIAAVMTLGTLASGTTGGQASDAQVRVYFAICEGSGSSDTIKIKRINEDGTGATTIGDTTIAYCANPATTYLSGLAVHEGYAYFSWFAADGSSAGLGRLSTTETGSANLSFATAPAGIGWLQVAPRTLNNYLYFYAHDGGQNPSNLRVMRVPLTGGTIENCFTPTGSPNSMAIGVGKDAVYYAIDTDDKKLHKVSGDCSSSSAQFDLADGNGQAIVHSLETSFGAALIAESDSRMFMFTKHLVTNSYGISHIDAGGTANDFVGHGTATSPDAFPLASQTWGVNRLYYKDGNATKMYAVTPGSPAAEVFANHMTGTLHHISVVSETPPTTTTTTTTSTTTTTVAPTTTTTLPKKVTTRRTTKLKSGATVKPLVRGKAKRSYTAKSLLQLPKGVTVTRLTTSTKSVCSTRGTTLRVVKKGTCRYSVRVVHKKRTTTLRVTMKVS